MANSASISRTALDREIWDEELASFVPDRIFDAHTHLWDARAARAEAHEDHEWCRHQTDLRALRGVFGTLYPGREVHCLAFGLPIADVDHAGLNRWVADQVEHDPRSRGAMLVHPDMSAESVAEAVARGRFAALKPYHRLGPADSTTIAGYFPEHLMEAAHALGLPVVLHCRDGVAGDLDQLVECGRRFPGTKWILAHCGAMFNPRGLKRCVQRLNELPNIWYDTALICEVETLAVVLKCASRKRILFGTDSALGIGGCRRGRVLSYGRSVLWLKQAVNATFWAYEQLRALARCCDLLEMSSDEAEDILCRNALDLFASPS